MIYAHEFEDGWRLVDDTTGDLSREVYSSKEEAERQLAKTAPG